VFISSSIVIPVPDDRCRKKPKYVARFGQYKDLNIQFIGRPFPCQPLQIPLRLSFTPKIKKKDKITPYILPFLRVPSGNTIRI
jgi:hypothetical protein